MSGPEPFQIRGWCPSTWKPMQAHDGWIVRVRPRCASLTAAQWLVLAELARSHASGQIELTRLGNLQLRGVHDSALPALRAALIVSRLAPADAQTDLAPAVHCTPFYARGDRTHALALALSGAAARDLSPLALQQQDMQALPGKFDMLVDDPQRHLRSMNSDLQLWACDDGRYGLALGRSEDRYGFDSPSAAVQAAIKIALWFARERSKQAATRLRGLAAPLDLRACGLAEASHHHEPRGTGTAGTGTAGMGTAGPLRPGTLNPHGLLLGAPLGRLDAWAMQKLAAPMPEQAEIRVTPWKSLLLPNRSLDSLPARLDARDWISRPADVRLRVSACTGAPHCPQAHIPAQTIALQFATAMRAEQHLHVSACAKLCALPADATDVVLASRDSAGQIWLQACPPGAQAPARTSIPYRPLTSDPHDIQQQLNDLQL
ncbi:nitrite reductase [uncultured Comamonas sp.]|uniref:nitrite reductase n=1 Tax=uncultured Comamonas sp. TaxID=114710 RepID=UPI0025F98236|nr:nitrite reductase [uncultured Comamonas sp.]